MPIHAIWNNHTLASTDAYKIVEGRYYFPPNAIIKEYFKKNEDALETRWKGDASGYDVHVGSRVLRNGAWTFDQPDESIIEIKDYIAFSDDVMVEKTVYGPKEK